MNLTTWWNGRSEADAWRRVVERFWDCEASPSDFPPQTPEQAGEALAAVAEEWHRRIAQVESARNADADLLGSFLHQFSQPLAALQLALELAQIRSESPDEYRARAREALEQANRLAGYMRRLRAFVELNAAGDIQEPANVSVILAHACDHLAPLAEARRVLLHFESVMPVRVCFGPQRLERALEMVLEAALCSVRPGTQLHLALTATNGLAVLSVQGERNEVMPATGVFLTEESESAFSTNQADNELLSPLDMVCHILKTAGGQFLNELSDRGFHLQLSLPLAPETCLQGLPSQRNTRKS